MSGKISYRKVLSQNQNKTNVVVGIFLILYLIIGLLIDTFIHHKVIAKHYYQHDLLEAILSFQIIPYATFAMLVIGVVSVLVTFSMHDKMMMWGSEYQEIDENSAIMLEEKSLYNVIAELKIAANLNYMPKVYLIHADYMNAFASGYSEKSAMVAITTGLMEKLNRGELQAVMAHEISHIKHMDIKLTLFVGVLSNIMLLVLDLMMDIFRFTGGGSNKDNNNNSGNLKVIVMVALLVLRIVFPMISIALTMFLSRTREYMADAGAVKLTRDKESLASALIKIHQDYSENEYEDSGIEVRKAAYIYNPVHSFLGDLMSTHPDLESRITALGMSNLLRSEKTGK